MTALPQGWPSSPEFDHPMTIAEYERLPEDTEHRWELQEGSLVMSPRPRPLHVSALGELGDQMKPQLAGNLRAYAEMEVNLELRPPDAPGNARCPDLIVIELETARRAQREGRLVRASEVLLAVEIVSPGSVRMDNITKRGEYADAGIPYYWIIDLNDPVSLIDCHLAGEFGYQDNGGVTGEFVTSVPFPLRIHLDRLDELTT
ncbi:Uma2 family endonuclease [Kutzneria sp. CA-103260]|uniref:Uma2 family endonuclease n=1 Tax=Kutzneria sp. CA-103260 TaxID=2802641 RepID=UPI001BEDD39C|nr:Uma2 family endonuclease [Kutzneria sp. CA-103260]QUQ71757.1 Uma2 family endonuclease [Kutzneria sp. CA-103260]